MICTTAASAQAAEKALARAMADTQLAWGPCPPFIPEGCEIAVLHGDPAKNNGTVPTRDGPGIVRIGFVRLGT